MKEHELKIDPEFFAAVASGDKTFEIRFNDRGFQKGDTLLLKPYSRQHCCYVEPYAGIRKLVSYVLSSNGIKEGYVVLGLHDIPPRSKP